MKNVALNWETPGDFDRLGYLNDALEETYKDVRCHHEEEKIRYRKHRKVAFKKGSRRQRMCKYWHWAPRNSMRKGFPHGYFQTHSWASECKYLHGRHSNSRDKTAMSYSLRKALDAADTHLQDLQANTDSWRNRDNNSVNIEVTQIWDDWTHLCNVIQSNTGFADAEMGELSCTDILYLATKYNLGGGVRLWEKPEATRYEFRNRNFWSDLNPGEIDIGDGTILAPVVNISSTCMKAEELLLWRLF